MMMPVFDDYFGRVFEGIHDALVKGDRAPIALWTRYDSEHGIGKSELEQIHTLVDLRVDGIILKPIFNEASDQYLHEIFQRKIPLVLVDRELPKVRSNFVGTDDLAGIQASILHLMELGHRSIAYFGPETNASTGVNRHLGFHSTIANYPDVKGYDHLTKSWEPQVDEARALFKNPNHPTAVIAMNDYFASAIYEAAKLENIRIPEDFSILGFGNIATSSLLNPPLTTMEQHPYDIGICAAELLLSRLEHATPIDRFQKVLIPPDMIVRQSTGRPRSSETSSQAATEPTYHQPAPIPEATDVPDSP